MRLEDGGRRTREEGWSELTYSHAGICRFTMAAGAFDLNHWHVLEDQPNLFRCDTMDAHGIFSAVRIP